MVIEIVINNLKLDVIKIKSECIDFKTRFLLRYEILLVISCSSGWNFAAQKVVLMGDTSKSPQIKNNKPSKEA